MSSNVVIACITIDRLDVPNIKSISTAITMDNV